jgi:hypothetical protein
MDTIYGLDSEISKKRILIATPTYEHKVHISYMMAALDTVRLLESQGFEVDLQIPSQSSLVVHSRNAILQRFIETDFDYLLMVDSDLSWDPEAVIRLIHANKEFSGGVYPDRMGRGFLFRPSVGENNQIKICEETMLIKMEYIPAGFILLKRSAIQRMQYQFPELYYESADKTDKGFCLFNTEVIDGQFWGEDYVFCRRAKESGIDIWVDPHIPFNHAGLNGKLMDVLTTNKEENIA